MIPNGFVYAAEPIVIGVPTALGSIEGKDGWMAVQMAVEEINAKGGVKVGKEKRMLAAYSIDTREHEPGIPVHDALTAVEKLILEKKPHAILLGAFIILGIVPGPKMITEHLNIVWGMVWVMVIANIFGAVTLYPLSGYMGRLAFLRGSLIIPPIMVLAAIGAFLIRGFWQYVLLAVMFGFLGYGMKKWKYPRAPLILGFILGPLAEDYLHKSLGVYGLEFLTHPVVLVLLVMVILSLGYSMWNVLSEKKKGKKNRIKATKGGMVFSSVILVAFVLCFWLTAGWSKEGRLFPQIILIPGIVLSLWVVVQSYIRIRSPVKQEIESDANKRRKELKRAKYPITLKNEIFMMSWVVGFLCLILVLGFWVAIALFIPIFMHLFGHESKRIITAYTFGTWGIIYLVFAVSMKVPLYGGIFGLAW